jgi:hypothetical protein
MPSRLTCWVHNFPQVFGQSCKKLSLWYRNSEMKGNLVVLVLSNLVAIEHHRSAKGNGADRDTRALKHLEQPSSKGKSIGVSHANGMFSVTTNATRVAQACRKHISFPLVPPPVTMKGRKFLGSSHGCHATQVLNH